MATGLTIVKQDTLTTFGVDGKPSESIRVQFMVDDDGPFFRNFAKDGFTGFAAKQELETFAREVRALRS